MSLFPARSRPVVDALAQLTWVNPFLAERTELERRALGDAYEAERAPWQFHPERPDEDPNVARLIALSTREADAAAERLAKGARCTPAELEQYESLVLFSLYNGVRPQLAETLGPRGAARRRAIFDGFRARAERLLHPLDVSLPHGHEAHHVFAFCFQVCRAFHSIFDHMVGSSPAAAALRASIWQSIFTHDLKRYVRALYGRMAEVSTLITGPSGTGKDLVARAIGLSSYLPFDPRTRSFAADDAELFAALNVSALSPTLIESELFGHKRGAFTGALADRAGWFETTHELGTVFLDEVGDIDPAIQVKLLRVLQSRSFQRLGDTTTRHFRGKVICATNRDPAEAMRDGILREDLYYRICSDLIVTPSLAEQLGSDPEELGRLAQFIARRLVGADEADALAAEVVAWVHGHLGADYHWPGNFRELEQCVRNVLVRGEYRPSRRAPAAAVDALLAELRDAELSAADVLSRYVSLVYARTGSYEAASRRLGLDRRTVKAKVDAALVARLRRAQPPVGASGARGTAAASGIS